MAAPCEQVTLKGVRLVRVPYRSLEYALTPDSGATVEMVRWTEHPKPKQFDPLSKDITLVDLAALANQSNMELIQWVSKWGLLGFRPSERIRCRGFNTWIIPAGRERVFGPEHRSGFAFEPLELIRESASVAKAAIALYQALTEPPSVHERARKIKDLVRPDSLEVRVGNEIQMRVWGVDIGKHPQPNTPVEYDRLALAGLGHLTDMYLGSEFQLVWTEERVTNREICLGWKVKSLLGALYLKLGYKLRRARCQACGASIGHLRQGAKTCSSACRQRLKRKKESKAAETG